MGSTYILWTILIAVSLWVSLGGFLWAHRHGQLRDQDRARFLPLRGETIPHRTEDRRKARRETATALTILFLGVSAIIAALMVAVLKTTGGRI